MNNAVFGKTMENVRKHKDIRKELFCVRTKLSHNKTVFSDNSLEIEMKITQILMNNQSFYS